MNVGEVFGRLTVLELLPSVSPRGHLRARVACECGATKIVGRRHLRSGATRSCGCLKDELTGLRHLVHGHSANHRTTPEYHSWRAAKTRVANPHGNRWQYYGERGVRMAEEWLDDFAAFLAHVGPRPGPGYSLDRIDNERGYEPGNVRWATASEQRRNQRSRPIEALTPGGRRKRLLRLAAGVR